MTGHLYVRRQEAGRGPGESLPWRKLPPGEDLPLLRAAEAASNAAARAARQGRGVPPPRPDQLAVHELHRALTSREVFIGAYTREPHRPPRLDAPSTRHAPRR